MAYVTEIKAGSGETRTIRDPEAHSAIETLTTSVTNLNNNAMLKAGGTFTGNVMAADSSDTTNRLRNIQVQSADAGGNVSTNYIIMVRK